MERCLISLSLRRAAFRIYPGLSFGFSIESFYVKRGTRSVYFDDNGVVIAAD